MSEITTGAMRLDKWLWATRFFKTRQIAIDAVNAGRIEVNGDRAKPSKAVKPGDNMLIRKPPYEFAVVVSGVSEKRGSATIAAGLYQETADSIAAREKLRAELREMPAPIFRGRPTKKDRRTLENWQRAADVTDDES